VYVDGFNLYYGALKGTKYKWLDLKALFSAVLRPEAASFGPVEAVGELYPPDQAGFFRRCAVTESDSRYDPP
jgi:hypothetical protein